MKYLSTITSLILTAILGVTSVAQNNFSTQSRTPTPSSQTLQAPPKFGLVDGTPVKLRLSRTVSSADAKVGETVDFEVLEDIKVGEIVVIQRGGIALATITEAQSKRRMGRGGKLNMNIDSVRLVTGEKAALRAVKEVKGGGRAGIMTGGIVATGIVFFPAAPFFLFIKGKDITIPKGTEITAYINGDISLDPNNFLLPPLDEEELPEATTGQAAVEFSSITIKSVPKGAEILINGKFVGSTPSTLRLGSGQYTIFIRKQGFPLWKRTITLSAGGDITIDAALENFSRGTR